jgi:hydrogenase maturation protease
VDVSAAPGTVFRIAGADLLSLPGSGNVHELALADLLNALRIMGRQIQETVLLGIQPLTTELGTTVSAPVQAAVPSLVEAALIELSRWTRMQGHPADGVTGAMEKRIVSSMREA